MRNLALKDVLKTAADMIFQTLTPTCPDLRVAVMDFWGSLGFDDFGRHLGQPLFIRSKQIDPVGHTTYVGTPIQARLIKRYESCFDLLDPPEVVYD